MVRRREGELVGIELLFEMATGSDDLLEHYERVLLAEGWQRANQPGLQRGGFEAAGLPRATTLINRKKRSRVYAQCFTQHEGSLFRVHYHPPSPHELPDDTSPDAPPGRSPLPALKPPAGVRLQGTGMGRNGHHWASSARAITEMPPIELEAYFAKQLELEGWGRVAGSADEFFAWSSWMVPAVPPTPQWHGVLLVLADRPGERDLSLWADSAIAS